MTERDDSIYAPSHDHDGFDARHEEDGGRGPLLLMVAFGVLLAFAAVVYTAYQQGLRKGGRDAAPIVSAENSPIKTRPAEAGGRPTPNLNNRAYEPLDDVKAVPAGEVTTAPLPEEPLARPRPATNTPPAKKPTPAPIKRDTTPQPVVKAPVKAPPKALPKTQPKAAAITPGDYVVQIAAFRSEDQALAAWAGLATRLAAVTAGLTPDVQRADLGTRGVYYRLRAASFASREAATAVCDKLKTGGQDCLVVRR